MNGQAQCVRADRKMQVRVGLGRRMADLAYLARIGGGAVVELDAACTGDVEVYVAGRLHARGQAVVVDGKLAVRVSEIVGYSEISGAMRAPPGGTRTE